MADTTIEWTDQVWNPTTGCDRVSPGCDHCYALTMAKRLKGMGSAKYQTDGDPRTSGPGFGLAMHDDVLTLPLRWRKPRRIFVNSMSDLFHPKVTDEFIARVFSIMALAPQHTFQLLTKRAPRMQNLLAGDWLRQVVVGGLPDAQPAWPLPNAWCGVSVENQEQAEARLDRLRQTPAAVRWVSCEPLLGPVDLEPWLHDSTCAWAERSTCTCTPAGDRLDWVVAGGESGPGARPMHPSWARSLRDQVRNAPGAFFFKQWGDWGPAPWVVRITDPETGRWTGTDQELADAKARAEAVGATHALAVWAHRYGNEPVPAGHKPWSLERVELSGDSHVGIRLWGKTRAGRELDGREWNEYPAAVTA